MDKPGKSKEMSLLIFIVSDITKYFSSRHKAKCRVINVENAKKRILFKKQPLSINQNYLFCILTGFHIMKVLLGKIWVTNQLREKLEIMN